MNRKVTENRRMILVLVTMLWTAVFFTGCALLPGGRTEMHTAAITSPHTIPQVPERCFEEVKSSAGKIPRNFQEQLDDILSTMQDDSSQKSDVMVQLCRQGLEVVEKCSYKVVGDREASFKLQTYRAFFNFVYNRWSRLDSIKKAYDAYEAAYADGANYRVVVSAGEKYIGIIAEAMSKPDLWDAPEMDFLKTEASRVKKVCLAVMLRAQLINCYAISRDAVNHVQVADACNIAVKAIQDISGEPLLSYSERAKLNDIRAGFLELKKKSDEIYSIAYNKVLAELDRRIKEFVNFSAVNDYNAAKANYEGGRHRWYWWFDNNEKLFRSGRLCNRITGDGRVSYTLREKADSLKSQVNSHLNKTERRDMNGSIMPGYEAFDNFPRVDVIAESEKLWQVQYHNQSVPVRDMKEFKDQAPASKITFQGI